jgi:hypothetical protein
MKWIKDKMIVWQLEKAIKSKKKAEVLFPVNPRRIGIWHQAKKNL